MNINREGEKIYQKTDEVREDRRGDVGRIILDAMGPNLLTRTAFDGMSCILDKYERDSSIKALELSGANDNFCGGVKLRWMRELQQSPEVAREAVDFLWTVGLRIGQFTKPTFAVIEDGACGGVGFELALQCQRIAVMKKNASKIAFGALAPEFAFMLGLGVNYQLPQKIGVPESVRFLTKKGTIDAIAAYKLGIVDILLPGDDFTQEVSRYERAVINGEIQKRIPLQYTDKFAGLKHEELDKLLESGCTKYAIERTIAAIETCSQKVNLAEAMELEKDFFLELFLSDEAKEKINERIIRFSKKSVS